MGRGESLFRFVSFWGTSGLSLQGTGCQVLDFFLSRVWHWAERGRKGWDTLPLRSSTRCQSEELLTYIYIYINIYVYIDIYILKCQKTTNTHSDLKEALKRLEFQGFCVFCLVLGLSAFFFSPLFCFSGVWVWDPFEEGERRAGSAGEPLQLPMSLSAALQEPSERALM